MKTLEIINFDGAAVVQKLSKGFKYSELSTYERHVLMIYNNLHGKNSGNRGKRTKKDHNNNW